MQQSKIIQKPWVRDELQLRLSCIQTPKSSYTIVCDNNLSPQLMSGGGAVHATKFESLEIRECHFMYNWIPYGSGSALRLTIASHLVSQSDVATGRLAHETNVFNSFFTENTCEDYTGVGGDRDLRCGAVAHTAMCTADTAGFGGSLTLNGNYFALNGAGYGAGALVANGNAFCSAAPEVTVTRTNFTQNVGAVAGVGSKLDITHCEFVGNVQNFWGGAAVHSRFGRLRMDNIIVENNKVAIDQSSVPLIQKQLMIGAAVFQLNDATGSVKGNSWMHYVILHGNQYAKIMGYQGINETFGGLVRWSDPGSIFLTSNDEAYLENAGVKIMNSTIQGGFLYLEKGHAVIYDMQFDYSLETRFGAFSTLVANWHGGVVYAADNATLQVQECLFRGIDVSAAGKNGGALYVLHSELIVIDSVFSDLHAVQGGAISRFSSTPGSRTYLHPPIHAQIRTDISSPVSRAYLHLSNHAQILPDISSGSTLIVQGSTFSDLGAVTGGAISRCSSTDAQAHPRLFTRSHATVRARHCMPITVCLRERRPPKRGAC